MLSQNSFLNKIKINILSQNSLQTRSRIPGIPESAGYPAAGHIPVWARLPTEPRCSQCRVPARRNTVHCCLSWSTWQTGACLVSVALCYQGWGQKQSNTNFYSFFKTDEIRDTQISRRDLFFKPMLLMWNEIYVFPPCKAPWGAWKGNCSWENRKSESVVDQE